MSDMMDDVKASLRGPGITRIELYRLK
jgi:hypothetical protein